MENAQVEQSLNSSSNTEEAVESPSEANAPSTSPDKKTFRVKVDGEEFEASDDDIDEDARHLSAKQMQIAAQKRMAAAAEKEKKLAEFFSELDKEGFKALVKRGIPEDRILKLAYDALEEKVRASEETPEQRRVRELEERAAKAEAALHDQKVNHYSNLYNTAVNNVFAEMGVSDAPIARYYVAQTVDAIMRRDYVDGDTFNEEKFDADFDGILRAVVQSFKDMSGPAGGPAEKNTTPSKTPAPEPRDEASEVADMIRKGLRGK